MRDRTGPASGHPLPVAGQRRLNLGLLQDLSWSAALHRPEPPEFRQRDDRSGLTAEVNHLIRFTWARIALEAAFRLKVIQARGGRPILMLSRDHNPQLPEGAAQDPRGLPSRRAGYRRYGHADQRKWAGWGWAMTGQRAGVAVTL
jgi:hypothetical protein